MEEPVFDVAARQIADAGTVRTQAELSRSSTVGNFRVIERIGSGGMGVVCKAEDLKLRRKAA